MNKNLNLVLGLVAIVLNACAFDTVEDEPKEQQIVIVVGGSGNVSTTSTTKPADTSVAGNSTGGTSAVATTSSVPDTNVAGAPATGGAAATGGVAATGGSSAVGGAPATVTTETVTPAAGGSSNATTTVPSTGGAPAGTTIIVTSTGGAATTTTTTTTTIPTTITGPCDYLTPKAPITVTKVGTDLKVSLPRVYLEVDTAYLIGKFPTVVNGWLVGALLTREGDNFTFTVNRESLRSNVGAAGYEFQYIDRQDNVPATGWSTIGLFTDGVSCLKADDRAWLRCNLTTDNLLNGCNLRGKTIIDSDGLPTVVADGNMRNWQP